MRLVTFLLFVIFISQISVAQHSLVKLWETDTLLKVPESVLFDAENKVLYVSNIEGTEPWGKDGKGSIAKVGLDGKIIAAEWINGLNAPKGMSLHKSKLYVADMTNIVVIDPQRGVIERTITVPDAGGLNDLSIGSDGIIWVSDSRNKKLYKVENDKPTLYLDSLKGPNGVLMRGADLYILDAGGMYAVKGDKTLVRITDGMEGGTDGIENISGNDFLVSCWQGTIWHINEKGEKQLLLDTKAEKKNTADIGFDPATKTLYVPTFWKNSVVAYQLK